MRLRLASVVFVLAIATAAPAGAKGLAPLELRTIPITTFEPGSGQTNFGQLHFLGGFTMLSSNEDFGAWSGLDFTADGTMVAIADTGFWLTGKLTEDNGKPTGLADPKIGVMLGDDGRPPPTKVTADAEGLRVVTRNGMETALVSFEQKAAIRTFTGPDYSASSPRRIGLPAYVAGIRRNQGLEAIAVSPAASPLAGATVVIAEHSLNPAGNHRGFVLSGPKAGAFTIRRSDDFDISDAAFLPDGDLLVLERRFSYSGGFGMRIRRVAAASIKPNATVDGAVLIDADNRYQIDNMEGLAVRATPTGETLLTLISDDNHGFFQRSILLQFLLPAPQLPTPAQ